MVGYVIIITATMFQARKRKSGDSDEDSEDSHRSRALEKPKKAKKARISSSDDSSDQAELLGRHIDKVVRKRLAKGKR